MQDTLRPKDAGEEIATFRYGIVGGLVGRSLTRGELSRELEILSKNRYRLPSAPDVTRCFAVSTLERWLYAARTGGLEALRPNARKDRGRGRALSPETKELLCSIRREHPSASVPLIIRTLEAQGLIEKDVVRASTVRRIYSEQKLVRAQMRDPETRTRLRWQAAAPDALWHGDVCHGRVVEIAGKKTPIRIHGLMDDCSRYVIALEARSTETEEDLLELLVRSLLKHGAPDALYFDNGACYRGEILKTVCGRLGIGLLHARPYDPQARGKMERFWRTLRAGCLDFLPKEVDSIGEINARLENFLERLYLDQPHAGLIGQTPRRVYAPAERPPQRIERERLREALTVRERRRVRGDGTLQIRGETYEVEQGYLAGRNATIAYSMLDVPIAPWVEDEGRQRKLYLVDATRNAHRKRESSPPGPSSGVTFDPNTIYQEPEPANAPATSLEVNHEIH